MTYQAILTGAVEQRDPSPFGAKSLIFFGECIPPRRARPEQARCHADRGGEASSSKFLETVYERASVRVVERNGDAGCSLVWDEDGIQTNDIELALQKVELLRETTSGQVQRVISEWRLRRDDVVIGENEALVPEPSPRQPPHGCACEQSLT